MSIAGFLKGMLLRRKARSADLNFFVGGYGQDARLLSYNADKDDWSLGSAIAGTPNASFAASCTSTGVHYLLEEGRIGRISAYRVTGRRWRRLSSASTGGSSPCFVAVDEQGQRVAIAHYTGGEFALFTVREDGRFEAPPALHHHQGTGPNRERQDGPHAHCARFYGDLIYQTDLGADEVLAHRMGEGGKLSETFIAFRAPAGEGPRHILFHPILPIAYLLTELGSKLFVLAVQPNGMLENIGRHSILPAAFDGASLGGHLAINQRGDRIYVSNRGHDSIMVFAVGSAGEVDSLGAVGTGGSSPRFFRLIEDIARVVVANQNSGALTVMALKDDGHLGPIKRTILLSQPAYIGRL